MKNILKKVFQSTLFQHSVFWIFSILFFLFIMYISSNNTLDKFTFLKFIDILVTNIIFAIPVYINLYVLLTYLFKKKKYFIYLLSIISLICISAALLIYVDDTFFAKPEGREITKNYFNAFLGSSVFIFLYVGITSFIKFMRDWVRLQELTLRINEMEKQNLSAELKSLKEQINPHFLFNTLNNLYSLSLDQSSKTPEMILKLSDLMRYILYDCSDSYVPFEKEVDFVKNYLELEKLRLNEDTKVELNIIGSLDNKTVAPLLLIPFIENAFKHGHNHQNKNSFVEILIDLSQDGNLLFTVSNSKTPIQAPLSNHKGIGIENAKKRLELLYPKKHKLNISNKENQFDVSLELNIE